MEVFIDNRQSLKLIDDEITEIVNKTIEECLIVEGIDKNHEVSVSFVDNLEIKKLNKDYRGINEETDVLSFPIEDDFAHGISLLGDIIVSMDKAIEQAIEYEHSLNREIAYLIAHSMFHLMGYDHLNPEDKIIMRNKEKQVMKNLSIFKNKERR